jgi:DNA invertase Pin-like site-specific DNA recombinase
VRALSLNIDARIEQPTVGTAVGLPSARRFVSYLRVSTRTQKESGLGLAAQRAAVDSYLASINGVEVESFEEAESGRNPNRPRLSAALDLCQRAKAALVIAKLDRLSRNVSFISQLMEAGVEFVAADMPSANRLTIHIVSAMAEYERDLISHRVKAALAAAIARGTRVGNPNVLAVQAKAVEAAQQRADAFALRMAPVLTEIEGDGFLSLPQLGRILERRGYRTAQGKTTWNPSTVRSLQQRIASLSVRAAPRG